MSYCPLSGAGLQLCLRYLCFNLVEAICILQPLSHLGRQDSLTHTHRQNHTPAGVLATFDHLTVH